MDAAKARLLAVMPPFLLDETVYNTLADAPTLDREPPSPLRAFGPDVTLRFSLIDLHSWLDFCPEV